MEWVLLGSQALQSQQMTAVSDGKLHANHSWRNFNDRIETRKAMRAGSNLDSAIETTDHKNHRDYQ